MTLDTTSTDADRSGQTDTSTAHAQQQASLPANIRATARLQFHKEFTFADAIALVDYYAALGISHLYASPILTSRLGSTHGYDTVDPTQVNAELGGEEGFRQLVAKLRSVGMGLVVDIVPNHMGVGGSENPWWQHVLQWGPHSPYAKWFDINWHSPDPAVHNKLLAPFLGAAYGETLASGDLVLNYDAEQGALAVHYHAHHFPIALKDYAGILQLADADCLRDLIQQANNTDWSQPYRAIENAAASLHEQLRTVANTAAGAQAITSALAYFDTAQDGGVDVLHRLLERQHYRLTWWRNGADEINWRRFFEVSELAGMRMEDDEVFEATHALIFRFYAEGLIDGLRIDHVDGLADPRGYSLKLRQRLNQLLPKRPEQYRTPPYIIVEKILAEHETLRADWQLDGTTGYDFMDQVGAVLHDPAGEIPLTQLWQKLTGDSLDFSQHVHNARRQLLAENLVSEFEGAAQALHAIARADTATRDYSLATIRRVLREILLNFPVYRTYASCAGRDAADHAVFEVAAHKARKALNNIDRPVVDILSGWLSGEVAQDTSLDSVDNNIQSLCRRAITRFQQLTPPLAAKSVEDTAFYRYGRLLSRNEVGSDPGTFSITAPDFHAANLQRNELSPLGMLATATHDHKRGEDVRSRITVLSEIPQRWANALALWMQTNAAFRSQVLEEDGLTPAYEAPRAWHELMLYQMLVGAWPLDLLPDDQAGVRALAERLLEWQVKGIREAKRLSNWVQNNEAYENACTEFLLQIMAPSNQGFLNSVYEFVSSIAPAGAINSLSQTVLRLSVPGVPDLYQGTEFWDFSLVDPDNRRPVDFAARKATLAATTGDSHALLPLLDQWKSGALKQHVIQQLLLLRQTRPMLFAAGSYVPLEVTGAMSGHVIAFARVHAGSALITVATRLPAAIGLRADSLQIVAEQWQDTQLVLPAELSVYSDWQEVLSGRHYAAKDHAFRVADILPALPQAVLIAQGL